MIKNIMGDEQVQLYLSNVQGRFLQRVQGIVFMSYIGLAAYSICGIGPSMPHPTILSFKPNLVFSACPYWFCLVLNYVKQYVQYNKYDQLKCGVEENIDLLPDLGSM